MPIRRIASAAEFSASTPWRTAKCAGDPRRTSDRIADAVDFDRPRAHPPLPKRDAQTGVGSAQARAQAAKHESYLVKVRYEGLALELLM